MALSHTFLQATVVLGLLKSQMVLVTAEIRINKMAKDGLDPCFQKMLEIIQDLCGPA